MGIKNGSLSPADSQYLAQLVAQRTGITPDDAQKRVNDTFAQAQQAIGEAKAQAKAAADAARKSAATLALWLVVSMLIGAFTASWAATFGGRLRDGVEVSTDPHSLIFYENIPCVQFFYGSLAFRFPSSYFTCFVLALRSL